MQGWKHGWKQGWNGGNGIAILQQHPKQGGINSLAYASKASYPQSKIRGIEISEKTAKSHINCAEKLLDLWRVRGTRLRQTQWSGWIHPPSCQTPQVVSPVGLNNKISKFPNFYCRFDLINTKYQ